MGECSWRPSPLSRGLASPRVSLIHMNLLFDSFWRAAAYCLHPRVVVLSLLPLVLMVVAALGLGYFYWEAAIDAVRRTFESWSLLSTLMEWLHSVGLTGLRAALAPMVVVFLATPIIVVVSLMAVAVMMTPSMLNIVAERRFPQLERKHGGSFLAGALGALWATLVALLAMLVSIPLWFVPPLVLILPPLIWGWLTYKVMAYDVLAEHASREERLDVLRRHRYILLAMGLLTGYLGAAPSLVWVSGVMFVALAPVLVPFAIWVYTLVFAFSSLWFSHYALAALQQLRTDRERADPKANVNPAAPVPLIPVTPQPSLNALPPP
jgi:hypothetical protein